MSIWIKELLQSLDNHVDESTKKSILGECGEKCPFTHFTDSKILDLKSNSSSEKEFLDGLCEQWRLHKKGDQYYVIFDQCYCPLVNENIAGASKTLCYCTLGNIKHKFRLGLGREVDVDIQKTILAGDDECRFHINI